MTARICTGCRAEIEEVSGRTAAAFLDKLAKMHAVVCPGRQAKEN